MAEIEYSLIDTIDSYNKLFVKFCSESSEYEKLNNDYRLIYLASGLGLSNSIHEKFIKGVVYQYSKLYTLSNNKRSDIIRKYKSPLQIKRFVDLFKLDLKEAFELNKLEINDNLIPVSSFDNLITVLDEQRHIRNNYMHGDFNFDDNISFDMYKSNIIIYQKVHSYILSIINYSFISNIDKLPNIADTMLINTIDKR